MKQRHRAYPGQQQAHRHRRRAGSHLRQAPARLGRAGGYGAGRAGHGHPAIVAAVTGQVARGTHFAQPTQNAIAVAGELARRWGLPQWRFGNSGTEAAMDAVHLMRSFAGRDLIIKVEGGYHGHHGSVQVSGGEHKRHWGDHPASQPARPGPRRAARPRCRTSRDR